MITRQQFINRSIIPSIVFLVIGLLLTEFDHQTLGVWTAGIGTIASMGVTLLPIIFSRGDHEGS